MQNQSFTQSLQSFLDASPTPFHAVASMKAHLLENHFVELEEQQDWVIDEGGRYFVTRNDSSIIAFTTPTLAFHQTGWRMIGAHTDSPCLKLKPNAAITRSGYDQLGVEVYGGVLLHTWLDRDLSIAGRLTLKLTSGERISRLVNFNDPIAVIPNLAIHLNRTANEGFSVNPQEEILPILGLSNGDMNLQQLLIKQALVEYPQLAIREVLDFELSLYDTQKSAIVGLNQEFITGARLDNLLSCFVGLDALIKSNFTQPAILVCTDHEEVGSLSTSGASGPFLEDVLKRLSPNPERLVQSIQQSMLISADNAHGLHPNYASKHDKLHAPMINGGAVIKVNVNQRYATNSETAGIYRDIAASQGIKVQTFVMRSDMACGSTIGPITAGGIGIPTLDIGLPTFAMHSIRELGGTQDAIKLVSVLKAFLETKTLITH